MITRKLASALGALALMVAGVLALTSPAQASAPWVANGDSSITGQYAVVLKGGNTSVETTDLGVEVGAGTVVTFTYDLADGATCTGGAPRVFVVVGGVLTNSWDQNVAAGKQCGADGKVTFTVPGAGTIGAAGVVFDNGGPGSVKVSNLRVDGKKVAFKAAPATTGPTATPTSKATTKPPVTQPPASPPAAGGGGGDDLPVTGASTPALAGGAAVVLGVGVGLFVLARRSRTRFEA